MKVAVVNVSSEVYNLATHRIAHYHEALGDSVTISNGELFIPEIWNADKLYFSVIFTWDLPALVSQVNLFKERGIPIEIGGPAATALPEYVEKETGIKPHLMLDERFEHVPGTDYEMIFSSRGCPRGCHFCIVQAVEGRKMIEYDEFPIPVGKNPWLADNNVLATSWNHQQLIVDKLKDVKNLDINSGFDCRIFVHDMEKYYNLYSQLKLERWRFAYDKEEEREPVKLCAEFLHSKNVRYSAISVFCLVGDIEQGDTFDLARERLQYLVDIGTSPYMMRYRPLKSLHRDYTPPGWNDTDINALFNYYGVPWFWRKYQWGEFKTNFKEIAKQQKERLFE
jgi:hypothetical protein